MTRNPKAAGSPPMRKAERVKASTPSGASNNEDASVKFRKKPVVIEAFRWFKNGDHPDDDCFRPFEDTGIDPIEAREGAVVRYYRTPDLDGNSMCSHCSFIFHEHGWIDTLEGGHNVCPGDWIITGVKGERYPCKPDIFEMTYETA